MVRKKIDNRIRHLIDNGVSKQHRSMFVIVGDKGRDQVVILHHMLSKSAIKARPDVLWCYKKELGFSSNKKKRMRELNKKIKSGKFDVNEDDPFELFIASTNIRYCYYSESHKILGNTYGMCVLQDFEALTPNLLARTIETVEGGGIIVILLRSVASLRQLYTMTMDVHSRFRTEAHQDVVGRFNERFILSLGSCENCLVMDDSLNILPISTQMVNIQERDARREEKTPEDMELAELKDNMRDVQPVGALLNLCKTYDQAKALLKFIDAISEKRLNATVSLTAARGRGKSAALGLAIAASVAFRFSSIYVTSPSPENLKTLFEFILKGFSALEYQEHLDFEVIQSSNPEFNKAVTRINFFKDHRQTIQYILPTEAAALGQAELVVIDEAAAIPLPLVKSLFGPHLVFMASTINGYEGTGRSLSLKLLQQIRDHKIGDVDTNKAKGGDKTLGRTLAEVTLDESIRYKQGDAVEKWLTNLLCLDATLTPPLTTGCPPPDACDLYYINRDTLFCYHKASEAFLQKLMSLYVASHYKNSPNDLQMLSDAPAHHLFALLGPTTDTQKSLPDVLAVVQVCLEGEISKGSITAGLARGQRASGDLIPWTVAQQFHDQDFPLLSGGRVVRVAVHPDYQSMGYGTRALKLLEDYYNEKYVDLDESSSKKSSRTSEQESAADILTESIAPRKNLPPLLLKLKERPPERLHYLGVSYGVTSQLLKFWKRAGYVPVYMRQTPNDLTGEHSCVMLKILSNQMAASIDTAWLREYWKDFKRRFVALLSYQFRSFSTTLAMSVLNSPVFPAQPEEIKASELMIYFIPYDVKRLELYTKNMADYHLIMDLVPMFARLFFLEKMGNVHISAVQSALLLGMGLQHKKVDELAKEFDLPGTQLLGLFNRITKKTLDYMNKVLEESIENEGVVQSLDDRGVKLVPYKESLTEEFRKDEIALQHAQKQELKKLQKEQLQQYAIKEDDSSWSAALDRLKPGSEVVSVSRKLGGSESDSPASKKLKVDNGSSSGNWKQNKKKKGNKQKGNR